MGLLDRIFERFALPLAQIGIESFVFAEVKIGHIAEQGRCRRLAVAVDEQDAIAPDREILRQMNRRCALAHAAFEVRSEEHTSELQSLMRTSYAVFGL